MTRDICGQYKGYQAHQRHGEPFCQLCRAAATSYHQQWRAANPQHATRQRARANARQRALSQLAAAYPGQYRLLYQRELRRAGDGVP